MPARKVDTMDALPGGLRDGDLIPVFRPGLPWYRFALGSLRPRDRRSGDGKTAADGTLKVAFSPPFSAPPRVLSALVLQASAQEAGATTVEVLDLAAAGCTLKAWRTQKIATLLINGGTPPLVPLAGAQVQATFEEDR